MAKDFSKKKSTELGDELSITLYLQSEINFCSVRMPDATSLHHCLTNEQLKLNAFSGKVPAKGVLNIMHT